MMIEGMGHDLPRAAWPQIIDAIAAQAQRADSAVHDDSAPAPTGPSPVAGRQADRRPGLC